MKKILLLGLLSFFSLKSFSQDSIGISPQVIKNSENVISYLNKKIINGDFLIYNLGHKYLVINKVNKRYKEFIIEEFHDSNSSEKKYKLLKESFLNRKKTLIDAFKLNFDKEKGVSNVVGQSYIYFCLFIKNKKRCEFFLPYMTYDKNEKLYYPIKDDLHQFLLSEVIK